MYHGPGDDDSPEARVPKQPDNRQDAANQAKTNSRPQTVHQKAKKVEKTSNKKKG